MRERRAVVPELDPLLHEPMRLRIAGELYVDKRLGFTDLRRRLATTDGNLSVHARKLEQAGYLVTVKFFEGRLPRTDYELTVAGRQAFRRYLRALERMAAKLRRR